MLYRAVGPISMGLTHVIESPRVLALQCALGRDVLISVGEVGAGPDKVPVVVSRCSWRLNSSGSPAVNKVRREGWSRAPLP